MSTEIVGHAVVSADGRIADHNRQMPEVLRNDKDWRRFQAALDRAALVVLGRLGHEAHPNPGRRRLVVTSRVERLEPIDELVSRQIEELAPEAERVRAPESRTAAQLELAGRAIEQLLSGARWTTVPGCECS